MSLSAHQIQVLDQVCNNAAPGAFSSVHLNVNPNECACWRWATNGLSVPIVHDPAEAFSYVSTPGVAMTVGSAWAQHTYAADLLAARQALTAYAQNGYTPPTPARPAYNTWFDTIVRGVATEMCRLCGLNPGAGPHLGNNGARYYVEVKFDRNNGHGVTYAPHYTHWWLRIELPGGNFVCIEMFPQANVLTFRWNNAHATNNVIRIEIANLHANHMAVFNGLIPAPAPVQAPVPMDIG